MNASPKILWALVFGSFTALGACVHTPPVEEPPLDSNWLQQVASDHNHEVLSCYEASLKTNAQLQGNFVLEMDTDRAGSVTAARAKKPLDAGFDACVVAKAKAWKFPWIKKETFEIDDFYHLFVNESGTPIAEFTGPSMDKEVIRNAVGRHLNEVSRCYEARLKQRPKLSGKLVLEWDIQKSGQVANAHVAEAFDPSVDRCVLDKLKTWEFQSPPKETRVTYPFEFSPSKRATEKTE